LLPNVIGWTGLWRIVLGSSRNGQVGNLIWNQTDGTQYHDSNHIGNPHASGVNAQKLGKTGLKEVSKKWEGRLFFAYATVAIRVS